MAKIQANLLAAARAAGASGARYDVEHGMTLDQYLAIGRKTEIVRFHARIEGSDYEGAFYTSTNSLGAVRRAIFAGRGPDFLKQTDPHVLTILRFRGGSKDWAVAVDSIGDDLFRFEGFSIREMLLLNGWTPETLFTDKTIRRVQIELLDGSAAGEKL